MSYADKILQFRGPSHTSDGGECVNHYEHRYAMRRVYTSPHGRAIRSMLEGWARYADVYVDRYDSKVGEDGVIGEQWASIGKALYRMLDGDLGGFDGFSLARNIVDIMTENECEAPA
jgi:hypothetical protein